MFLGFGAIPTYPVLGNPVTSGERDVEALLDRLEASGFYAIEVIPHRNTRERLAEIVSAARRRWWPVFNGTEHNTPEARPLARPVCTGPGVRALVPPEHRADAGAPGAVSRGEPGFVGEDGQPSDCGRAGAVRAPGPAWAPADAGKASPRSSELNRLGRPSRI